MVVQSGEGLSEATLLGKSDSLQMSEPAYCCCIYVLSNDVSGGVA